ncbi:HAMP domain-containing sensor histidine kinase [Dermatophilaceae bacterium Sec6.4]
MNRDEALNAMSSDVPAERLESARYLQFWAIPADIPQLRSFLQAESVGWISRSLKSALARLGDAPEQEIDLEDYLQDDGTQSQEVSALARARIARTVVHELEPIVGAIQYYASREVTDYSSSRTASQVNRMARLLRAIETLGRVSGTPRIQKFDLATLIAKLVEAEQVAAEIVMKVEGPGRLILSSDPDLIELVLGNALRNAAEAINEVLSHGSVAVVYGGTDRDFWVTISDNGKGLPTGSSERLFDVGTSTKEGHLGMGLALSIEATRTLGGKLRLSGTAQGARFEMNVPDGVI